MFWLWVIIHGLGAGLFVASVAWVCVSHPRLTRRPGACARCGYDLAATGIEELCPECGASEFERRVQSTRERSRRPLVIGLTCAGFGTLACWVHGALSDSSLWLGYVVLAPFVAVLFLPAFLFTSWAGSWIGRGSWWWGALGCAAVVPGVCSLNHYVLVRTAGDPLSIFAYIMAPLVASPDAGYGLFIATAIVMVSARKIKYDDAETGEPGR